MALLWTLLILFIVYLYLIAPRHSRPDASTLTGKLYAHRGLHDGNHAVPENSLAAFRLAVEAGYGIELDVQLTADHKLVVHHDGTTGRVCGTNVRISETDYASLPLLPDGSPIPTFAEVLALVNGKIPLIVEVKQDGGAVPNAAATLEALRSYAGPYCVESFHPLAVRYFRKNAPQIVRGQLAMGGKYHSKETDIPTFYALKYLLVNVLGRPHFIAYSSAQDHNLSVWLMKRVFRPLMVAWTIRSQRELDQARRDYSMLIFELFTPDQKQHS